MTEQKIDVEIVQTKIVDLNVKFAVEENTAIQIDAKLSSSVFEPKDEADPTTMLKLQCEMKDAAGEQIDIKCTAEMIVKMTPIPANRIEAVNEYCQEVVQTELVKQITKVLVAMGHNFAFNQ